MMKKFTVLLITLWCLALSTAQALSIQPLHTKNGVPILLVERHQLPMLDIAVIFPTGSARDGKHHGLANLTAAAMAQQTNDLSEEKLMQKLAETGAILKHNTRKDYTEWTLKTLTEETKYQTATRLLNSILAKPDFSQKILKRLKKQIIIGIEKSEEDPFYQAKIAYFKAQYAGHPYAHPAIGTKNTVRKITAKQVSGFYHRYYTLNNAQIIVVGDITRAHAIQLGEKLTSGLREGKPAKPIRKDIQSVKKNIFVTMNTAQSTIFMGQVGFSPYSNGYYARMIGNDILGGAGLNSILNKEVREKRGLAYFASSQIVTLAANGPLLMYSQTQKKQAQKTNTLIQQIYRKFLMDGISQKALDQAKRSLTGKIAIGNVSNTNILTHLIRIAAYHYPLDYFKEFSQHISKVTRNDVKASFSSLRNKGLVSVVVGQTHEKAK